MDATGLKRAGVVGRGRFRIISVLLGGLLAAGCLGETNPCPHGQRPDRESDRCVSANGAAASLCPASELARWTERFTADGLVTLTQRCTLSCDVVPSCIADCLVEEIDLTDCAHCARESIACATLPCAGACARGTDAECRACQCDTGCVLAFDECANTDLELELCADVHGFPSDPDELDVRFPVVLRRKSTTGFTRAMRFVPEAPGQQALVETYAASGFTDFVPLTVGGVDYVLEILGGCSRASCPVRISPMRSDGRLALPAWRSHWELGWDVVTTVGLNDDVYVLVHKTGARPITGAPRGTFRAYRVRAADGALEVDLVYEDLWAYATEPAWSHVRGFASGGLPHLLRYRSEPEPEAEVLRISAHEGGLILTRVSRELGWESGWDIVETFPADEQWFVLQYAGSADGPLPAGTARIRALLPDAGGAVIVGPVLASSSSWQPELDAVVPFRTAGGVTHLLRLEQETGRADFVTLSPDVATWQTGGLREVHAESWGVSPPWDVVTVARARLWSTP